MKINCIIKIFLIIALFVIELPAQPTKIRVACIGNSITWGGLGSQSYPQQLGTKLGEKYDVRNYGVSARTLLKKGDYPYWKEPEFTEARNFDPHIVIIKLGTNDSKPQNWIYKDEFFGDYMNMVAEFRKLNRRPQIYVCFPVPVFQTNWGINDSTVNKIIPIIDSVRKEAHTFLIDFNTPMKDKGALFPDGVHPNAQGYGIMAQIAYDTIMHGQSGVIRYFYAANDSLNKNETTTLYWNTSENSQVLLNGNPVNAVDSLVVSPTQTTTYTLITKGNIADTMSRTVYYYPPGKIKTFSVDIPFFEKGKQDTIALQWTTGSGSTVTLNGLPVSENGKQYVTSSNGFGYTLIAHGDVVDSQKIQIPNIDPDKYNRAFHRAVNASSTEWGFYSNAVNDGNVETEWKSGAGNSQSVSIDLGKTITVNKVVLNWGRVYGTRFYLILS
ncbi:MAG: GDSL-type esterase/lipase family protein, partial [Bacteroidota bacterium]|nr:GDSL-type esterase/lipase family protein [Bacteroidota bacterium]